jgi:hypothetical protein
MNIGKPTAFPALELSESHPDRAREEMQEALHCLARTFALQFRQADLELTRTQALLKDAIEHLTASFSSIHAHVAAQRKLALTSAVHQGEESRDEAIDQALDISIVLERDLDVAIRSLQFQDISTQLLEHAKRRLWAMGEVLSDIDILVGEAQDEALDFIDHLYRHKDAILHKASLIDEQNNGPVSQEHMGIGDIELF